MDDFSSSKPDTTPSSSSSSAAAAAIAKVEDSSGHAINESTSGGAGNLSPYSGGSTPEQEQDHEAEIEQGQGLGGNDQPSGNPQQQKRKGGRKPIYATSEERKQRNRQAQAAFRERRTEYIKQLESTIKVHEENLHNLQASHRTAADECLMLRYKNSLLERILIEKGIDVQAELRAKTGSPNLGPTRPTQVSPTATAGSQPIGRFPISKFNPNRRSLPGINGKADGVNQLQDAAMIQNRSPLSQPTSASHISSPNTSIARSPNFIPQGGQISPSFGPLAPQGQPIRPQQPPLRPQFNPPARPVGIIAQQPISSTVSSASAGSSASLMTNSSAAGRDPSSYYPSPFQNHYDQLEQEYDAQADMMDDTDPSDNSAAAIPAFPTSSFAAPPIHQQGMPTGASIGANPNTAPGPIQAQAESGTNGPFGALSNSMFDPYDPMLDADPFGLSASMHFPTQFSFDTGR